jgi:hypothetical protein
MAQPPEYPPRPPFGQPPMARRRSPWQYIFGVIVIAYAAVLASVIWIGAGFGAPAATATPARVALAYLSPTPTASPPPAPTPTAAPPTAPPTPPTPTPPPPTPTPDPNIDFRVPLAASNTGTIQSQRVAILGITDDARSPTTSARTVAGFKFVTIEVLVENTGDAPVNLGRWQVQTNANAVFGTSAVTGFGTPLPATTTVAPHAIVQGVLVFSVPTAAKLNWIQYTPDATHKGALYFDAT